MFIYVATGRNGDGLTDLVLPIASLVVTSELTDLYVDLIVSFLHSLARGCVYQSISQKEFVIGHVLFLGLVGYNFVVFDNYVFECFNFICDLTRDKIWFSV
jgi:hypothetical protein